MPVIPAIRMPLYDFGCSFCGHSFEAVVAAGSHETACPLCVDTAHRDSPGSRAVAAHLIEARQLGVEDGTGQLNLADIYRYRGEYGDDAAETLLDELWDDDWPSLQALRARCAELGLSWVEVENEVFAQYRRGFLAVCR